MNSITKSLRARKIGTSSALSPGPVAGIKFNPEDCLVKHITAGGKYARERSGAQFIDGGDFSVASGVGLKIKKKKRLIVLEFEGVMRATYFSVIPAK